MGTEIERKFLVVGSDWQGLAAGVDFRQGYLSTDKERAVRVRIAGDTAYLTIKGKPRGITRAEFEYEIPIADANAMLDGLCHQPIIEKTRYRIPHNGKTWDLDVFHGVNDGLIVAEVELASEEESFDLPDWAGEEVSDDPRYANASLISHPFTQW
ncbi:MAG: CYTH domain-containing protein [Magnetospiraceae bacterium]